MIYIHAIGIHNAMPENEQADLKSELKALSGKVYRRIDHFIQLAIIGAHKAAASLTLPEESAIYMTSGQGNISVFERVREQRYVQKLLPKPVDFINLLSNSAGFYVASHLGLSGKNLFLAHHRFPVQMTLLAAQNDVILEKQRSILVGGVDEWIERQDLAKKLLGVSPDTRLGEGSNWMLLSKEADGALGRFDMKPKALDRPGLDALLAGMKPGTRLAFSSRFTEPEIDALMNVNGECSRYVYEDACGYYETLPLYAMNRFLSEETGTLWHVDVSDGRYMLMRVDSLRSPLKGGK